MLPGTTLPLALIGLYGPGVSKGVLIAAGTTPRHGRVPYSVKVSAQTQQLLALESVGLYAELPLTQAH